MFQFVIAMIACAINERMQRKLDYTQEEVRVLKEILVALIGSRRISFTADHHQVRVFEQFVIFGERHLRYLIKEFVKHYLTERFHQTLAAN